MWCKQKSTFEVYFPESEKFVKIEGKKVNLPRPLRVKSVSYSDTVGSWGFTADNPPLYFKIPAMPDKLVEVKSSK